MNPRRLIPLFVLLLLRQFTHPHGPSSRNAEGSRGRSSINPVQSFRGLMSSCLTWRRSKRAI